MVTKKHLREENIRLQCRIEALENIVCPGGEHDWFKIDVGFDTIDGVVFREWERMQCKRCGKVVTREV